jgi:hypothetical protein
VVKGPGAVIVIEPDAVKIYTLYSADVVIVGDPVVSITGADIAVRIITIPLPPAPEPVFQPPFGAQYDPPPPPPPLFTTAVGVLLPSVVEFTPTG